MTALVRRRAWGELCVRPWTFLTLVLIVAAVALVATRWGDWRHEKWVIENGTPVNGEVFYIGRSLGREGNRDEALYVALRYTPPNSTTPLEAWNDLPRQPGKKLSAKDVLHIHIDPAKPEYWTERTEPAPLALVMVTPLLCGAVAVLCGILAIIKRAGAIRAYKTAEPRRATVVSVRQSPLAPFSKLVGVTLDDVPDVASDRRVRDCYWPNTAGPIHPKQPIEVLVGKRRIFAAAAYGQSPTMSGDLLGNKPE
ncbi:MAG: hypothetical protein JWM57_3585 [Phycisphaerales bacterium]|nr:hypothetical protein [Phycisphaerales bacterium]